MPGARSKTRITCKLVVNLTAKEYAQCLRLNLGRYGIMRDYLRYCRRGRSADYGHKKDPHVKRAQVLLLREVETGILLAWCLIETSGRAMMYVRVRARRQGLGTRLLRALMRVRPDARICPWDELSRAFYRQAPQRLGAGRLRCANGYSLKAGGWPYR